METLDGIRKQLSELVEHAYRKGYDACNEDVVKSMRECGFTSPEEAYQKGLDDAWEAARKIANMDFENREAVLDTKIPNNTIKDILMNFSASEAIAKIKAYEEQKKAEEAELKVGTRVRTSKNEDFESNEVFPVGTIGVIEEIDTLRKLPYKISANGDYWFYSRDMFEVIGDDEILVGDEVKHYADGTKAVVLDFVDDGERVMIFDKYGNAEGWELSKVRKTGRSFPQIAEVLKQLQEGE